MEPAINGILVIPLILGLVEFLKKFGITGQWALASALAFGVLFGISYQISASGVPVDFNGWLAAVVYGLALGLSAAGLYDWSAKFRPQS